jgi:hypothetical protein
MAIELQLKRTGEYYSQQSSRRSVMYRICDIRMSGSYVLKAVVFSDNNLGGNNHRNNLSG